MIKHKIIITLLLPFCFIFGCFGHKDGAQNQITIPDVVLSHYFKLQGSLAENDCGPVAEFQALRYMGYNFTMEQIITDMGWHRNIPNITDTLIQHKAMLVRMSVNHKIKLSADIGELEERLRANTPVVILLRFSATKYHWVVLTGFFSNRVFMSWGDGRIVSVTADEFVKWFTGNAIMYFR